VLHLPICLDLLLQANDLVRPLIGFAQRKEADYPNRDQEHLDYEEGYQQFRAQRAAQFEAEETVLHRRAVSACSRRCRERALTKERGWISFQVHVEPR
jgi:hypothetical protein